MATPQYFGAWRVSVHKTDGNIRLHRRFGKVVRSVYIGKTWCEQKAADRTKPIDAEMASDSADRAARHIESALQHVDAAHVLSALSPTIIDEIKHHLCGCEPSVDNNDELGSTIGIDFNARMSAVEAVLPKRAAAKLRSQVKAVFRQANATLQAHVEQQVEKLLRPKQKAVNELATELRRRERELEKREDLCTKRESALKHGIRGRFTDKDRKLIRGCLHPDKLNNVDKGRLEKAFNAFVNATE